MRTFLAIDLPEAILISIRKNVFPLQSKLPDDQVRWVPADNMHITIKFLGESDPSDLLDIKKRVAACCREVPKFGITFGGLGAFPSLRRVRVLWIGARDHSQGSVSLHSCIESALEPLGFEKERRGLHLHVTWGRVRRGTKASALRHLGEELSSLEVGDLGRMTVEQLTLYESKLLPAGAEYVARAHFPLGRGGTKIE